MAQRPPSKRPPRPGKRERGSAATAEQPSRRPTPGPRPSADPPLPEGCRGSTWTSAHGVSYRACRRNWPNG